MPRRHVISENDCEHVRTGERKHKAWGKCNACYEAARRAANPEQHREQARKSSRKSYAANPEKHKEFARKSVSNWPNGHYNWFLSKQEGQCAICYKPMNRKANADHDHKTGQPRGLLCCGCNTYLGYVEKHLETLEPAILALVMKDPSPQIQYLATDWAATHVTCQTDLDKPTAIAA